MNTLHQFITEKLYKNQLNPKFWAKNKQFDPNTREKLIAIATDFTDKLEITQYVKDITLTGSIANYNYTRFSDLDVHILLDFKDIDENIELVKSDLDGKRFIWNLRHDIIIKSHEVELYFQDINEPHTSTGVFSLKRDKWIKEPTYNPPVIDEIYVKSKTKKLQNDIDLLERKLKNTQDSEELSDLELKAQKYREKIMKMRKDSLQEKGEYGIGNLVFKQLRNSGHIEKIIDISNQAYDKIYSENCKY